MNHRRYHIGSMAAVSAILTLATGSALAGPALPAPENSLLGVRLMSRFADVLHKFGQPTEIQVGAPTPPAASATTAASGGAMGGGMAGAMGGRMGGGMPGMMGGAPMGGGGYPGMMGGRMGGAPMGGGGYPGMMGGAGGKEDGGGGMAPGAGRGLPGFAGAAGGGMMGGGGYPGMMGGGQMGGGLGAGNVPGGEEATNTETTWWYHFPQQGVHFAFLFNKDGRVIQIQEYGWSPGKGVPGVTKQGIALGSSLSQIIRRYGWSSDGENAGENITLRYGGKQRLGFQLVRNKVAGITLAVGE